LTSALRSRFGIPAAIAILALVALAATAGSGATATGGPVYWGAWIEGGDTYHYLYGGAWGNAPWDTNTWSRFESNAGKRVSLVHWGLGTPWRSDFNTWWSTFEKVRSRGDLSLADMTTGSVSLREIAAGRFDAPLRRWMQEAAQYGHPFFLDLDVEMNGSWEPYAAGRHGNTPSDFVRMWRHVHDLSVQAGATNITWVWAPNVDPRHKMIPYARLYPGDAYVDWVGLDGFNKDGRSSFAWLFGSSYRTLLRLAPSKPIMVTQVGSIGSRRKANWIADALSNELPKRFPRIRAIAWFNWLILDHKVWWPFEIESSAASQAAFASGIASARYAAGGDYGNLPLHTKIAPP
jgi:hypothetical protein